MWLQSVVMVSPIAHNVASNSTQGSDLELLIRYSYIPNVASLKVDSYCATTSFYIICSKLPSFSCYKSSAGMDSVRIWKSNIAPSDRGIAQHLLSDKVRLVYKVGQHNLLKKAVCKLFRFHATDKARRWGPAGCFGCYSETCWGDWSMAPIHWNQLDQPVGISSMCRMTKHWPYYTGIPHRCRHVEGVENAGTSHDNLLSLLLKNNLLSQYIQPLEL